MADKIGGVVIDTQGAIYAGASVEVTLNGTSTLAALFADIGLTTSIANPTTTDERGKWGAYLATGTYDVRVFNDFDEDVDEYVAVT